MSHQLDHPGFTSLVRHVLFGLVADYFHVLTDIVSCYGEDEGVGRYFEEFDEASD
jgi:hypothetical protein